MVIFVFAQTPQNPPNQAKLWTMEIFVACILVYGSVVLSNNLFILNGNRDDSAV
jgi:hypothetical protein